MRIRSQRDRYVYARSWLFILTPITIGFAAALVMFALIFATGFVRADGEKLLWGGFGTLGPLLLLLIVGTQLRNTIRDAKTERAQRRER